MDRQEVIDKFNSKDSHSILSAVWWILSCTDREFLSQLIPHIKEFRKEVKKVDLGGMLYSNAKNFEMAMSYITDFCSGQCHCDLYLKTIQFGPEPESRKGLVTILNSKVEKELYEEHFDVECSLCKRHFKVREVHGWHVPWYEWKAV